jgi:hypothetical protein
MSRNSILINPINKPIIMATVNINNTGYKTVAEIISGISTAKLKNGILIRNYGFSDIIIYNDTAKNKQREINIIPNESIFINLSDIENIQIKTDSVLGSIVGIITN